MEMWDSIVRMASALAIVLALMVIVLAAAKRWFGTGLTVPANAPLVQVLGSGFVGHRKSVALVSVAGELLILGMTPTHLVTLGRVEDTERATRLLARAASPNVAEGLSSWFQSWHSMTSPSQQPVVGLSTPHDEARGNSADGR